MKITVRLDGTDFRAELDNGAITTALAAAMPLTVRMTRWGDELYGDIGEVGETLTDLPEGREIMSVGELAYWKPGNALCIFYGPTPVSTDSRPRAASAAVVIGRVLDEVESLKSCGPSVKCELIEEQ